MSNKIKTQKAMAGDIDPIEQIMRNVAGVDFDSYGNSDKQPGDSSAPETEPTDKAAPSSATEGEKKTQIKTMKPKAQERQASNNNRYSTIIIPKVTRDKIRMAKIMYESEVGSKVTINDFLELLIEKGLPALSQDAGKRFKALNFKKE